MIQLKNKELADLMLFNTIFDSNPSEGKDSDSYIKMLEAYAFSLERVSEIKDEIIGALKGQINQRDEIINNHEQLLAEAETANSTFLKVLMDLKTAKNSKEYNTILRSYDINSNCFPFIN